MRRATLKTARSPQMGSGDRGTSPRLVAVAPAGPWFAPALRGWPLIDARASERFMAAPWLAEVPRETKRAILGALVEARAPAGATLLEQSQHNDRLTFLIEGTAEIQRTFSNGRQEVLTTLTAPAVFGAT